MNKATAQMTFDSVPLKQIFGRVESPWRPADPEEGFEIVRRRLFEPIPSQLYAARDATARSFSGLDPIEQYRHLIDCQQQGSR